MENTNSTNTNSNESIPASKDNYFKRQMKFMKSTKVIVLMGLFIALNVVFTRVTVYYFAPYSRITLQFLSTSFVSGILGPILGGINAAISDIVGFFLFPAPVPAPFFPGFTLSALLSGLIYGVFLFKKPKTLVRITLSVLVVSIFIDLGINTLWLYLLYREAWIPFFAARLIKTAFMIPVQIILMQLMFKYIGSKIKYVSTIDLPE